MVFHPVHNATVPLQVFRTGTTGLIRWSEGRNKVLKGHVEFTKQTDPFYERIKKIGFDVYALAFNDIHLLHCCYSD